MKRIPFNSNWIGIGLLLLAFGYSAVRFAYLSIRLSMEEDPDAGVRVIRVLHWQLEPGYREGLQAVMDAYNELPHVRENNVQVRQLAVTERVYTQFINVHMISGTAPDINLKGKSALVASGTATARFFMPISEYVEAPNPYNAPEFLPEGLDPELAEYLATAAWSETFTDGMQGGWDEALQDYYAVPVSSWGAMRTFYNRNLTAEIKEFLAAAWDTSPHPDWLVEIIEEERMVTPDDDFRAWLRTPDVPDTLGRFMVFNEAAAAFARETPGHANLVPISGSSYGANQMHDRYRVPFTYRLGERIDMNRDSWTSGQEVLATWQAGKWDFDEPSLRDGYFELVTWLARYFPPGFLGLDREQAGGRFRRQQAVFLTSGGWDASTIFQHGREAGFEVGVIEAPMPGPGERWYELSVGRGGEAETSLGVPLAIYSRSRNPDWALDFLRYASSFEPNQKLNEIAGWVPSVVGTRPRPEMMPFLPNADGLKGSLALPFDHLPVVANVFRGAFPLLMAGEISYEEFVTRLADGFNHSHSGIDRMWQNNFVGSQDRARQNERSMVVVSLRAKAEDEWDDMTLRKYFNLFETNLRDLDGFGPPALFYSLFDDREYPTQN